MWLRGWLLWTLSLVISQPGLARPTLGEVVKIATDLKETATIEAVTTELGKRYPELRKNFVLMHDSRSRQYAEFEFPRVISHSPNAHFTMAFNGAAGTNGYDELEMWQFDEPTATFEFQRITFRPGHPAVPKPVNESLCKNCHGRDLRPNWESYNRWPGAYPDTDVLMTGTRFHFGWKSVEHDGFEKFYDRQLGRGRYEFLDRASVDGQFVVGNVGKRGRVAPSHFTQLVGYMNYRRLARLLAATPDFAKYQYAIAAALYDCPNFEAYLPADYKPEQAYSYYADDTLSLFKTDANYRHYENDVRKFAQLRYALEGRGISMAKWSTNFRGQPYGFVTPGGDFTGFLLGLVMEKDDALKPYRVWNIVGHPSYGITTAFTEEWTGDSEKQNRPACEGLLKKSREIFSP